MNYFALFLYDSKYSHGYYFQNKDKVLLRKQQPNEHDLT